MGVNQLGYHRIALVALKFALLAMLITISTEFIAPEEGGILKEVMNMISFIFLYSIFVFFTIHSIKRENNNVISFKEAFIGGGMYIFLTGIIYALFLTFIKRFDMAEIGGRMRAVWEQNQIPEQDIQLLLEQLNNSTIFIGVFVLHIGFGLFCVLLVCIFTLFSPFTKK